MFSRSAKISSRKIKLPQIFFPQNLLHCRNYIQKYWFEGENAIDNSVVNTSSGTLVIVYPSFFCVDHNKKRKCYQFYIFERDLQKIAKTNSQQGKPVFSNRKN